MFICIYDRHSLAALNTFCMYMYRSWPLITNKDFWKERHNSNLKIQAKGHIDQLASIPLFSIFVPNIHYSIRPYIVSLNNFFFSEPFDISRTQQGAECLHTYHRRPYFKAGSWKLASRPWNGEKGFNQPWIQKARTWWTSYCITKSWNQRLESQDGKKVVRLKIYNNWLDLLVTPSV